MAKRPRPFYNTRVARTGLETTLMKLSAVGQLVKDRPYRQVWRFEHEGRGYYLKFYPKAGLLARMGRGSRAMAEFVRLQMLQKADIPAPRAVAVLMGFRIGSRTGDAVIMDAIEPGITLDKHIERYRMKGEAVPGHRKLADDVIDIVAKLAAARIGHSDLHLGNFLLSDGKLFLLDGYAVRPGGMKTADLFLLGHSVQDVATRSDVLRAWWTFQPGERPPGTNPLSDRLWKKMVERMRADSAYSGTVSTGAWRGRYFKSFKAPKAWSRVSRLNLAEEDWGRVADQLLRQLDAGQVESVDEGRFHTDLTLQGRPVPVEIRRRRGVFLTDRPWVNAWELVVRDVPTAWPILFLRRRVMGIGVETLIVVERPTGQRLDVADLSGRGMLLRRLGRVMRKMEGRGVYHPNPVAGRWIASDETPLLMDADELRRMGWHTSGIQTLLESLRKNPTYSPAGSREVCEGFAPFRGGQMQAETG